MFPNVSFKLNPLTGVDHDITISQKDALQALETVNLPLTFRLLNYFDFFVH